MAERLIHALQAGGGWLALGPLPGPGDVARLADWGADLVISMTPEAEMRELGAADLALDLARRRIAWAGFPITDFGAPGEVEQRAWPGLSERVQGLLAQGGRVFIHCRGGCGRSGMAVLRILVELGEPPEIALNRLRIARPCAVEAEKQLKWASLT